MMEEDDCLPDSDNCNGSCVEQSSTGCLVELCRHDSDKVALQKEETKWCVSGTGFLFRKRTMLIIFYYQMVLSMKSSSDEK